MMVWAGTAGLACPAPGGRPGDTLGLSLPYSLATLTPGPESVLLLQWPLNPMNDSKMPLYTLSFLKPQCFPPTMEPRSLWRL